MTKKIVKNRQGIYCDHGKHVIKQGEEYFVTENGSLTCHEHRDNPPKAVK